jgi:light-regulated signal transduction histidine kinase (bacteriophytochrome)
VVDLSGLRASNHLEHDFPGLNAFKGQDAIAGLLYIPLTFTSGDDFMVFIRKAQTREVRWAGRPNKYDGVGGIPSLEPREGFKSWSETVIGKTRPWTNDQMESAGVLALTYGKFIQVWRDKQNAAASNELAAILLTNTSHAVRTPLSQIINTIELALAEQITPEVRQMLEASHAASRALHFHIHDLLDLTRVETGRETAFHDPSDLRQSIRDACRIYETEAK